MQAGDPEGLRELLVLYGSRVRWYLKREFPSLQDLELDETLNEAAHRAWRAARTFDPELGTLRGWLYKIVRNCALMIVRREKAQGRDVEITDWDLASYLAQEPGGEPEEGDPAFLEALRRCVAKLPPRQRAIIEADLLSRDVAEARALAEEMGISQNAIFASRSIARKALRLCLADGGHPIGAELVPPEETS